MRSWACSRWTRLRCRRSRTGCGRARSASGNLFRDQLDRYGELEHVAERWRGVVRGLGADAVLVVNGDDPQVGDLSRERTGSVVFGLDDTRQAVPELLHAADSKWCLRCGKPYEYAAIYVGHLGDYRCPACGHARPALDVVARDIELRGLEGVDFTLEARGRDASRRALRAGALQRLQRARCGVADSRARRVARRDRRRVWPASARHSGASSGSSSATRPCSSFS